RLQRQNARGRRHTGRLGEGLGEQNGWPGCGWGVQCEETRTGCQGRGKASSCRRRQRLLPRPVPVGEHRRAGDLPRPGGGAMKLSVSQGGARTEISKASVQRVGLRHPADLAAGTLDGVEVVDGGLRLGSGHELIENGDFSAGMAGWRLRAPDRGTARVVGGELEIVDDGSNPNGPSVVPDYSLSLSVGAWYRAACDYRVVSGY